MQIFPIRLISLFACLVEVSSAARARLNKLLIVAQPVLSGAHRKRGIYIYRPLSWQNFVLNDNFLGYGITSYFQCEEQSRFRLSRFTDIGDASIMTIFPNVQAVLPHSPQECCRIMPRNRAFEG